MSAFEQFRSKAYPFQFQGKMLVRTIAGGTPSDPRVAEGFLRTKLADKDDLIREMVATLMIDRGITEDEAIAEADKLRHLNGFKRTPEGLLYIEGRQLKAAIKEAGCVAMSAGKLKRKWGTTGKGIKSYLAEHVFVIEDTLTLGVTEPTGIMQRFVHTYKGAGIQYEEYVENAEITFTVVTDQDLSDEEWAMLWLTGEQQGIGATRSQGFGRYQMMEWAPLSTPPARRNGSRATVAA
jgi:hypothetical protein